MTCILPLALTVQFNGLSFEVVLGGREKAAVICDCDGRWSTQRMHQMLSAYLQARVNQTLSSQSSAYTSGDDALRPISAISSICERSLRLLHVFRPTSSVSLAATLVGLSSYHSKNMRQQEICMLMIDSMSAFHWPGRWNAEQATNTAAGILDVSMQHVLGAIHTLRLRLGLITVLTNWTLIPNAPVLQTSRVNPTLQLPPSRPYFKQHLLPPFPALFTPNAVAQGIGATKITSPFTITHHITLIPVLPSTADFAGPVPESNLSHIAAYIRTPNPGPQTVDSIPPVSRMSTLSYTHTVGYEQIKQSSVVEGELEFDIGPNGILWSPRSPASPVGSVGDDTTSTMQARPE